MLIQVIKLNGMAIKKYFRTCIFSSLKIIEKKEFQDKVILFIE